MKTLTLLILLFAQIVSAQGLICSRLFADANETAYYERGERLAKRYPQFKEIILDPHQFYKKYEAIFERQKSLHPENPYGFDFSDWAMPLFQDMHTSLLEKREKLNVELNKMQSSKLGKFWNKKKIADLEIGLRYFEQLQRELESYLNSGKVDYKTTFELSYFYSRAIGLFDISILKLLNLRDKLTIKLDQFTEGFDALTVQQEFDRYLQRDAVVFDKKSPISTWEAASKPFVDAIFDPNKLEVLILPTTAALGNSIFMHLLNTEIYLIGVTATPIPADGYVRPGGLFMMHDFRHSSFMYYRNLLYREQHNLTREQVNKMSRIMAQYTEELDAALKAMPDKNLAAAIRYYLFNQHHDGGYHYSPTNYEQNNAYHAPFILYTQLVLSNQRREAKSYKDIARARDWLEAFWLARVNAEKQMISDFQKENSQQ